MKKQFIGTIEWKEYKKGKLDLETYFPYRIKARILYK